MTEIASREFMDNLVSLIKAYTGPSTNDDVKNKILDLIQAWATAAEGRYNLVYISEVYKTLQREGFRFPPKVEVASSMFDSNAVSLPTSMVQVRSNIFAASGMGRLRCLHALSNSILIHKSQASLSKLWECLLWRMFQ